MDNLTHSLAGAVLGQMGLKRKTALAMPTLIIAANIPDIDAVATLLGGHQHLAIRRGITHGPIAMLVLPLLLTGAMLAWDNWKRKSDPDRSPIHNGWLLALAYIGTLSHPALDWLNSYGIRLLEPFSSQWFYGDTIFIIDIWIWAALATSVWVSRKREKARNGNWQRPAWVGFAAICGYIFANGLITGTAETRAMTKLREHYDPTASMDDPMVVANPVPIQFWKREILWRDDQYFGDGTFTLGGGVSLARSEKKHNADSKALDVVARSANHDTAAFLFWSRMPFIERNQQGENVALKDQRFNNPLVGDRFTARLSNEK